VYFCVINYDKRLFPNSFVLWNVCNAEVRRWYWHKKAKKRKKKPHCSINFIHWLYSFLYFRLMLSLLHKWTWSEYFFAVNMLVYFWGDMRSRNLYQKFALMHVTKITRFDWLVGCFWKFLGDRDVYGSSPIVRPQRTSLKSLKTVPQL